MSTERTAAQQYVADELTRLLSKDSPYRVGALVLTYDSPDGDPLSCRVAHGIGLQDLHATQPTAVHLTNILKTLRHMADEMERMIKAGKP